MTNALTAFVLIVKRILACMSIAAIIAAYTLVVHSKGRIDYHNELIDEMEAKGGAPILLYPPDAMFEYPEEED